MMHDDSENQMFRTLLADYSAPVDEDGFSAAVLQAHTNLKTAPAVNARRLRMITVGVAGGFGAAITISKIPALGAYLSTLQMPSPPLADTSILNGSITESLSGSPYSLIASGLVFAMMVFIAGSLMLSEDV